ncbi:hypothetical protein DSM03_1192 [Leeuwenhoekiella aestuarii]|nr:hypothetical protein DSM03_1192 [Leeuwenhoekiella aestuarii]
MFLSLVSCGSSKQDNAKIKSGYNDKIVSAYDNIAKNYKSKIVVSNEMVNIDIVNFTEKIAEKQGKKMSVVLDSLIKLKERNKYEPKQYPIKELVKNMNKTGALKIFFSEPKEEYVMVEVFEIDDEKDYEKLTMFGSSDVYLLYFKGKQILSMYKIKLDYN